MNILQYGISIFVSSTLGITIVFDYRQQGCECIPSQAYWLSNSPEHHVFLPLYDCAIIARQKRCDREAYVQSLQIIG